MTSLLNRKKAANAVTRSGPIHPHSLSSGIGDMSRARSAAIRSAVLATLGTAMLAVTSRAASALAVSKSAPPGPLSSGSMAGGPA